jgi:hypothetical protein
MKQKTKKQPKKTPPPKEEAVPKEHGISIFTREDFLRDLRKVIRRLPKASLVKGKRKTSE